jgi:Ca2+-binding EF-hand superfamily protein
MLGYSTLVVLVFGFIGFINCMKLAENSPQAIAVNQATLGNDAKIGIAIAEPYFPGIGIPSDIQEACAKYENPQQQFSRVTENRNDSIDFAQFLQLDACATAWRKHDFMKIDTNNDSKISNEEWNAHNEKLRKELEDAILSQKNFTFNRLDSNGDEQLSKKELKKYLEERAIDSTNLTSYLNGSQLNFTQFASFDSSIPNSTFPFKHFSPIYDYSAPIYSYGYEIDGDVVDPINDENNGSHPKPHIMPQPRPAILPQTRPAILPAIDVMPLPVNISPPIKGDNKMSIQIEPPLVGVQVMPQVGAPAPARPIGGPAAIVMPPMKSVGGSEGKMSAAVMPQ